MRAEIDTYEFLWSVWRSEPRCKFEHWRCPNGSVFHCKSPWPDPVLLAKVYLEDFARFSESFFSYVNWRSKNGVDADKERAIDDLIQTLKERKKELRKAGGKRGVVQREELPFEPDFMRRGAKAYLEFGSYIALAQSLKHRKLSAGAQANARDAVPRRQEIVRRFNDLPDKRSLNDAANRIRASADRDHTSTLWIKGGLMSVGAIRRVLAEARDAGTIDVEWESAQSTPQGKKKLLHS